MKIKKDKIIHGESINFIKLETVKVMNGSSLVDSYIDLNDIPAHIYHMIIDGVYHVEDATETILL